MLPECQTFFGGPVPTSLRSDGLEESNEWTRIGPGFNSSFIFMHKNRYFFCQKRNATIYNLFFQLKPGIILFHTSVVCEIVINSKNNRQTIRELLEDLKQINKL